MPDVTSLDGSWTAALAALPVPGDYFSIVKIVIFLAAALTWTYSTAWVFSDLRKLDLAAMPWLAIIFSAGFLSCVVWIVLPLFWASLILYLLAFGGALVGYSVFHNRRVSPAQTILTAAHLKRVLQPKPTAKGKAKGKGPSKAAAAEAADKTRIKTAAGKTPPWPTEPQERAGYKATQDLLFDAIWRRAGHVRMEFAQQQPVKLVFNIDGVDRLREALPAELGPVILRQFKLIAGMDVEEHRRPQVGHFKAAIGAGPVERKIDVEAKSAGTTAGQRLTLRLISDDMKFRLPDLGLTKEQLQAMEKFVGASKGVLICCGTPGCGMTSTQYAILRSHDAFMQRIHTLEMSKVMDLENITQHVFNSQASPGVTFGKMFRSVLQIDANVFMAADTPDAETAAEAARSVRQGKKVYVGMKAQDCFSALRKYLEYVGDPAVAGGGLIGVVNQRLVRILCTSCRKAYKPDPSLLKKGNLPLDQNRPFFRPPNANEIETDKHGNKTVCAVCEGTGYVGRTGVFEVLPLDSELRTLIAKGTPLAAVKTEARKKGMLYLQEIALRKVFDGVTSINEVLRVTRGDAQKPS